MLNLLELVTAALFIGVVFSVFTAGFIVIIAKRCFIKSSPDKKPDFLDKPKIKFTIIALAIIGIVCILYGYFIEPNWIKVTNLKLVSPKIGGGGKTVRIVHISDLHIESEGRRELAAPELINSQNPQIIILTGDYLNDEKGRLYLANFLSKLKAPYGIYAVPGNFEWRYKSDDILAANGVLSGNNISINLDNLNVCLYLCGLNSPTLPETLDPKQYNIFVFHSPDLIPEATAKGFDLYLGGHTHGGQVRLPFYGALITFSKYGKKYEMGYYKENHMNAYINSGLGMEGGFAPRVRFLSRPEIAIIDIVTPE
ncbi:MAG: metallophosphoesterase [Candidatus Brocadiia bacterium]